jgi:alkylhydroperoxidase family enzyme
MGVRQFLDEAQGVLMSARRRAEAKNYSREVVYDIEVVIRACSRIVDMVRKENRDNQKEEILKRVEALKQRVEEKQAQKNIKKRKAKARRAKKVVA